MQAKSSFLLLVRHLFTFASFLKGSHITWSDLSVFLCSVLWPFLTHCLRFSFIVELFCLLPPPACILMLTHMLYVVLGRSVELKHALCSSCLFSSVTWVLHCFCSCNCCPSVCWFSCSLWCVLASHPAWDKDKCWNSHGKYRFFLPGTSYQTGATVALFSHAIRW